MMVFVAEDADFGVFGGVCVLTAVTLSVCAAAILWWRPHLAVRPSMQLACLYIAFFLWPLTVFAPNIAKWLPDPYAFLMALAAFVLALFVWNLVSLEMATREVWRRTTQASRPDMRRVVLAVVILSLCSIVIMTGYFHVVPPTQTGLVVALIDPSSSTIAREESLKLLDDVFTKYSFSIFASGIGPMLGVLLGTCIVHALRVQRYFSFLLAAILFVAVLVSLSITGARSFAVSTLLAVFLAALLRRGFRMRLLPVVVSALLVVLPAILITVFREGRGFEFTTLAGQIMAVVGERMFVSPLEVGATYVHLAQTHGYIGLASIPKLAELWNGSAGMDVPNIVGLSYFGGGAESVSANAGFVPSYFAYFGPLGVIAAIVCAASLDLVLLCYRWIDDSLLVPCMGVLGAAMLALLSVDFTVILITYGFLIVPAIASGLSFFMRGLPPVGSGRR